MLPDSTTLFSFRREPLTTSLVNHHMNSHVHVYTQCAYFPEENAVGPDISLSGEAAIEKSLNGHPAHRQQSMCGGHIHFIRREQARHAKVRNLQSLSFSHQNVPTGQVTVDYAQTGQIVLRNKQISIYIQWILYKTPQYTEEKREKRQEHTYVHRGRSRIL